MKNLLYIFIILFLSAGILAVPTLVGPTGGGGGGGGGIPSGPAGGHLIGAYPNPSVDFYAVRAEDHLVANDWGQAVNTAWEHCKTTAVNGAIQGCRIELPAGRLNQDTPIDLVDESGFSYSNIAHNPVIISGQGAGASLVAATTLRASDAFASNAATEAGKTMTVLADLGTGGRDVVGCNTCDFLASGFTRGDRVYITGFINAANNTDDPDDDPFIIYSVTANSIVLESTQTVDTFLVTEIDTNPVTITSLQAQIKLGGRNSHVNDLTVYGDDVDSRNADYGLWWYSDNAVRDGCTGVGVPFAACTGIGTGEEACIGVDDPVDNCTGSGTGEQSFVNITALNRTADRITATNHEWANILVGAASNTNGQDDVLRVSDSDLRNGRIGLHVDNLQARLAVTIDNTNIAEYSRNGVYVSGGGVSIQSSALISRDSDCSLDTFGVCRAVYLLQANRSFFMMDGVALEVAQDNGHGIVFQGQNIPYVSVSSRITSSDIVNNSDTPAVLFDYDGAGSLYVDNTTVFRTVLAGGSSTVNVANTDSTQILKLHWAPLIGNQQEELNAAPEDDPVVTIDYTNVIPAGGGGDASGIAFTPTTDLNWTGGVDPGDLDDTLDQIGSRATVLEGGQNAQSLEADLVDIHNFEAYVPSSEDITEETIREHLNGIGDKLMLLGREGSELFWTDDGGATYYARPALDKIGATLVEPLLSPLSQMTGVTQIHFNPDAVGDNDGSTQANGYVSLASVATAVTSCGCNCEVLFDGGAYTFTTINEFDATLSCGSQQTTGLWFHPFTAGERLSGDGDNVDPGDGYFVVRGTGRAFFQQIDVINGIEDVFDSKDTTEMVMIDTSCITTNSAVQCATPHGESHMFVFNSDYDASNSTGTGVSSTVAGVETSFTLVMGSKLSCSEQDGNAEGGVISINDGADGVLINNEIFFTGTSANTQASHHVHVNTNPSCTDLYDDDEGSPPSQTAGNPDGLCDSDAATAAVAGISDVLMVRNRMHSPMNHAGDYSTIRANIFSAPENQDIKLIENYVDLSNVLDGAGGDIRFIEREVAILGTINTVDWTLKGNRIDGVNDHIIYLVADNTFETFDASCNWVDESDVVLSTETYLLDNTYYADKAAADIGEPGFTFFDDSVHLTGDKDFSLHPFGVSTDFVALSKCRGIFYKENYTDPIPVEVFGVPVTGSAGLLGESE